MNWKDLSPRLRRRHCRRAQLASAGGCPALPGEGGGEQRSGAGKVSSRPSIPLCQQGRVVKEGMLAPPEEPTALPVPQPWGMLLGERRPARDGPSRLVTKLGSARLFCVERLASPAHRRRRGVGKDRPNSQAPELEVAFKTQRGSSRTWCGLVPPGERRRAALTAFGSFGER